MHFDRRVLLQGQGLAKIIMRDTRQDCELPIPTLPPSERKDSEDLEASRSYAVDGNAVEALH